MQKETKKQDEILSKETWGNPKSISQWSDYYENMTRDVIYHDKYKSFADTVKAMIKARWDELKAEGKL